MAPITPGERSGSDLRRRIDRVVVHGDTLLSISALVDDHEEQAMARVDLCGELCPVGAPRLEAMLDSLIEEGVVVVDVDMARLELCTAQGINALTRIRQRAEERGGALRIHRAHGVVARVLEVAGVPTGS